MNRLLHVITITALACSLPYISGCNKAPSNAPPPVVVNNSDAKKTDAEQSKETKKSESMFDPEKLKTFAAEREKNRNTMAKVEQSYLPVLNKLRTPGMPKDRLFEFYRDNINWFQSAFAAGKPLIALGGNTECDVWDLSSGKRVQTIKTSGFANIALSFDGKTLATSEFRATEIPVWDVASGALKFKLKHGDYATGFQVIPDGNRLMMTSFERGVTDVKAFVTIWDLTNGKMLSEKMLLKGRSAPASVAFTSDGSRIAGVFSKVADIIPSKIAVYDLQSGDLLGEKVVDFQNARVAFSPDGSRLAYSFGDPSDCKVFDWNLKENTISEVATTKTKGPCVLTYTVNGENLLFGDSGPLLSWSSAKQKTVVKSPEVPSFGWDQINVSPGGLYYFAANQLFQLKQ